jgi:hypothetical protein
MFVARLQRADRVRRYSVSEAGAAGWEVRFEEDYVVKRLDYYRDWHRVERALASFEREVEELTSRGWHLAGPRPEWVNR